MIIFMQSSTVGADWHSMVVVAPFSMLLMLQMSHFAVSVGPTAHHLMGGDVVAVACSGRQGNQILR